MWYNQLISLYIKDGTACESEANILCFSTLAETMEQQKKYVNTTDTYTSDVAVGGPGGGQYSLIGGHSDPSTAVAKRITFYRDQQRMRGIVFERHDSGQLKVGGDFSDPNPVVIDLAQDEQLTQIKLYSSDFEYTGGPKGRLSGFIICTNKKDGPVEAFAYGVTPAPCNAVEIPVGSGQWSGIFGCSGYDIDCFGMAVFKQPV